MASQQLTDISGTALLLSAEERLDTDTSTFVHISGFKEGEPEEMETSEHGMLTWAHPVKGCLEPPFHFVLDDTAPCHMTAVGRLLVQAGDYRKKQVLEMMDGNNNFTAYALGSIQLQHGNNNSFSIPRVHHALRDPEEEGDKKLVTVSWDQLAREHHVEKVIRGRKLTVKKIGSNGDEVGHGHRHQDGRYVFDDLRLPLQDFVLDFQSTFHLAAKHRLFAELTTLPEPQPKLASLANGMMLEVGLIGQGRIQTEDGLFNLPNVLHVKGIPHDLVSVSWHQLQKDHHLKMSTGTTDQKFTINNKQNKEVGKGYIVTNASSVSYRLDRLSVVAAA